MVQGTEAGVEVVAVGIDEFEKRDREPHLRHSGGKLLHAAAGGTEPVSSPNARAVRMPEQVAVAFEIFASAA